MDVRPRRPSTRIEVGMLMSGGKGSAERRRYVENRARRTADGDKRGAPWTIPDARTALDVNLSVPEAATMVGRTAVAVERLRAKWRRGELPAGLADQVAPPPPRPQGSRLNSSTTTAGLNGQELD